MDGDGIPNHQELDSDGDGIFDIVEAGGQDQDNNSNADEVIDSNQNGVADIYDTTINGTAIGTQDLDNDGKADF